MVSINPGPEKMSLFVYLISHIFAQGNYILLILYRGRQVSAVFLGFPLDIESWTWPRTYSASYLFHRSTAHKNKANKKKQKKKCFILRFNFLLQWQNAYWENCYVIAMIMFSSIYYRAVTLIWLIVKVARVLGWKEYSAQIIYYYEYNYHSGKMRQ